MEEFYTLLRSYNQKLDCTELPGWTRMYTGIRPPVYWTKVGEKVQAFPKSHSVFEIGSGTGDVLALVQHLGFDQFWGIERDAKLAGIANKKIHDLGGPKDTVITGSYPCTVPSPDILLQVNCTYFEGITRKQEFIGQLQRYYENADPKHYLLEVIDRSFTGYSEVFPDFVRLSEAEMHRAFSGLKIQSWMTYRYPENSSSKRLYLISK